MSVFPTSPVDARIFFEETIPALFDVWVLEEKERAVEVKLGVVLLASDDDQGGDWTLHFSAGRLDVSTGRATDCDLTIVQSVSDWRSALWEGHPGLIADGIAVLAKSGPSGLQPVGAEVSAGNPEALKGLSDLKGLIEAVIVDEKTGRPDAADSDAHPSGAARADWKIAVQLGSGPISDSPDASIRLDAEQAEAIRRGELHPVEALITGQLRLEGDLGLIIQLQAIAMLASPPPSTTTSPLG
jgi:hypothetical protein